MKPSRAFLVAITWCAFSSFCLHAKGDESSKPNIVVILADDLGFSDLGCYGGEIDTPNLDRLAADGLRFTQFYNTSRCWPTRAALLTGYYAQQINRDTCPSMPNVKVGKRPEWAKLLPEIIKTAGYRSYHSGKWHIDGNVLDAGFARSYDVRNQGNYFSNKNNAIDDQPIEEPADDPDFYVTTATADHAIECLADHAKNHPDAPFFSYVAFIAPHFPLHARPADIAMYQDRYLDGWEKLRAERHARQVKLHLLNAPLSRIEYEIGSPYPSAVSMRKLGSVEVDRPLPWEQLTSEQQRFQATKMAIHAAMVHAMDREIGRIVDQLKQMSVFDNTLVLFASDNGASAEIVVRDGGHDPNAPTGSSATHLCLGPGFSSAANTPFRRHKTWVHEGGISTPLIVHWPAGIAEKNAYRHTPAHVIDFVPTVLELTGLTRAAQSKVEKAPPAPGKSLVAALQSDVTIDRDYLWWLHNGNRAIRVGDWKLVSDSNKAWELYNLSKDRTEQDNLAEQMPERVQEMSNRWEKFTQSFENQSQPDMKH